MRRFGALLVLVAACRAPSTPPPMHVSRLVATHREVWGPLAYTRSTFDVVGESFEVTLPVDASLAELTINGQASPFVPLGQSAVTAFEGGVLRLPHGRVEIGYAQTLLDKGAEAVRSGDFAIVRLEETTPVSSLDDVAVLVDTSGSMVGADLDKVDALLAELRPRFVAAFDQEVVPFTKARQRAGATDIDSALGWAFAQGAHRAIVVTDGHETLSTAKPVPLARVDVVAVGNDAEALHRVAARGAQPGTIMAVPSIAALRAPGAISHVSVVGAVHMYPSALAKTGTFLSEALAFVELPHSQPLAVSLDSAPPRTLANVASAPAWLVERAVAEARVRELDVERTKNAAEIVALGTRHHILTALTGLRVGGAVITANADRDADGIPDPADKCPLEPETANGYEDDDGCPDRGQVVLDEASYDYILQRVYFRTGQSRIEQESSDYIAEIATMLEHHPAFELVGTFGHAADNEPAALADARAKAVRDALIARHISPARVVAQRDPWPIEPGTTAEIRAKNQSVEFRVLVEDGIAHGSVPDIAGVIRHGKAVPTKPPLTPELQSILDQAVQNPSTADAAVRAWLDRTPGDPRPWIARGALHPEERRRSYGSLLEFATEPEQFRAAGGFLESVGAWDLALTAYSRAPTDARTRRLYAWALARSGDRKGAFNEMFEAMAPPIHVRSLPIPLVAPSVLRRDLGLIAAMYARDNPAERDAIFARARAAGAIGLDAPSGFAVLTWETPRSDLDLLAVGAKPDDVAYAENDVTDGYGPELLPLDKQRGTFEVHLINRGSAPYTLAKLTVFRHDGRGNVTVEDHPFVIENQRSKVTF